MTDLAHRKQGGLGRMAEICGIFKVTVVDRRPPTKGAITARHGFAQATFLRDSRGLR